MPEVAAALQGRTESAVRINDEGETIVSVAVPIQRMMATRGALLLSTQGGDIDQVIASERWAILRFFLVLAAVMLVLSLSLANTIAEPVRQLAEAAERVRRGIRSRQQIPDFTERSDEIGHLSRALRDMTQALYNRIDAIESFAADVAHELKNPLTSLRSAVETLPRVKPGPSRDRLLDVMQHDVRRLDRLISDISDASRLDAELARGDAGPVDVAALLRAVVSMAQDSPRSNGARIELSIPSRRGQRAGADYFVLGHDSRLAQVVTNLIDNACSFSEPGGRSASRSPERPSSGGEAPEEQGGHHRRRRRSRHSAACARAHIRALLHRSAKSGLWPELRPRTVDLASDRRSAWRAHLGRQSACRGGRGARRPIGCRRARRARPARRGRPLRRRTAGFCRMSAKANLRNRDSRHGGRPRRDRRADPRPVRLRQERAGAGVARALAREGVFGALIGDDRVWVRNAGGRLVARRAPKRRGSSSGGKVGLIAAPHRAGGRHPAGRRSREPAGRGRACRMIPTF